ncbi:MAG TPA: ATP-binding protein [Gemmataceae bacterium]|nr:ATP-binding protein [Gemmataceae bacterium]
MATSLRRYTAEHRYVLARVARAAGFADPVAVDLDEFAAPLLRAARKRELLPLDGVLIRDWGPDNRREEAGVLLGARLYEAEGIRFALVRFPYNAQPNAWGIFNFTVVDRKDYRSLYRLARRLSRVVEAPNPAPVLPADQLDVLWKNTIGYLDPDNLRRIRAYGGRAKRGLLLTGSPGNGKTMACRWVWEECRRRGWEWRLVTPDAYRQARSNDCIEDLFSVQRCGVLFFDDMDLALRDRETVHETEDQGVFLSALDGIAVHEGVVFVFTTNCSLGLIDRAFKRPGRIDVVLHFRKPDAGLRRALMERWHEDIRRNLDLDEAVAGTEGYSFAEVEELKNLLVMHFMDAGRWDWDWARRQFDTNRSDLKPRPLRHVGFGNGAAALHGNGNGDGD